MIVSFTFCSHNRDDFEMCFEICFLRFEMSLFSAMTTELSWSNGRASWCGEVYGQTPSWKSASDLRRDCDGLSQDLEYHVADQCISNITQSYSVVGGFHELHAICEPCINSIQTQGCHPLEQQRLEMFTGRMELSSHVSDNFSSHAANHNMNQRQATAFVAERPKRREPQCTILRVECCCVSIQLS